MISLINRNIEIVSGDTEKGVQRIMGSVQLRGGSHQTKWEGPIPISPTRRIGSRNVRGEHHANGQEGIKGGEWQGEISSGRWGRRLNRPAASVPPSFVRTDEQGRPSRWTIQSPRHANAGLNGVKKNAVGARRIPIRCRRVKKIKVLVFFDTNRP